MPLAIGIAAIVLIVACVFGWMMINNNPAPPANPSGKAGGSAPADPSKPGQGNQQVAPAN